MRKSFSLTAAAMLTILLTCQNGIALSQGQFSTFAELSAEADPHTGSANFAVPVEVPTGRGGIQPNIQLQYNSNMPNGILGMGWTLEAGSIRRSNKRGFPQYDDTDTFILLQNGSVNTLAFDESVGYYRYENEGSFLKIEKLADHWRVTDKRGVKYYFGESNNAREVDPYEPSHIYMWGINRVEDPFGNYMTYTYQHAGNRIYPQSIEYAGHSATSEPPYARIEFEYESRPEITIESYQRGFRTSLNSRLNGILVRVDGALQRKYHLQYAQGGTTRRSLLTSVVMYGADGQSVTPPVIFTYEHDTAVEGSVDLNLFGSTPLESPLLSGDINGDGWVDIVEYSPSSGIVRVSRSTGAGFSADWTRSLDFGADHNLVLGDFDGDGRGDLCRFNPSSGTWDVALFNGSFFGDYNRWLGDFGSDEQPGSGDINGDGKTDIMTYYKSGGSLHVRIALNTGGGFTPWAHPDIVLGSESDIPFMGDFNGDGLFDFGVFDKPNGEWKIKFNRGKPDLEFISINTVSGFGQDKNIVVADMNNDGLTDIGYYDDSSGKVVYRTSEGKTFSSSLELPVAFHTREAGAQVLAADFNGDALTDFAVYNALGSLEMSYSNGRVPDLLTSGDNGVGGLTTIEYGPFVRDATMTFPMPFPIPVVKTITRSNNLGISYASQYEFETARWNAEDREFIGFGTVVITDQDGNYVRSRYITSGYDQLYWGRIREQSTYDASGKLYNKVQYDWDHEEICPGINFVYLERKDTYVYERAVDFSYGSDRSARGISEYYIYNESYFDEDGIIQKKPTHGDIVQMQQYEQEIDFYGVAHPVSQRNVKIYYTNNPERNLFLPYLKVVEDGGEQGIWPPAVSIKVGKVWFDYDGLPNGAMPDKGLLTRKTEWSDGSAGDDPVTTYTYDAYGNLLSTTSPKGNATADPTDHMTTITYDSIYHMFPVETQNALGHIIKNEFYGVNEAPESGYAGLWGQLKSSTDPNDQTGKRIYDEFGRVVKTVGPEDSVDDPTTAITYRINSDHVKVTTRVRVDHGHSETVDTHEFIDGLGRLIQAKTPSAVPGRYTVSGLSTTNSRGLIERQYLPFFSTNPVDTIESPVSSPGFSESLYDALGRVTRSINPDGTYANIVYGPWSTESYDENGHRQDSEYDAFGRLIKKIEYTGADGRASAYDPQSDYTVYAVTRYQYDIEGNLVKTIDAKNNETVIEYDKLGRKIFMEDPDMGIWRYKYDQNGNLTEQADAKGQVIHFAYDELDRLVNKTDGKDLNVDYTYDDPFVDHSKGRFTKAQYGGGETEFTYDPMGREIGAVKKINNASFSVQRNYDAINELLDVQYPDGEKVFYQYNAAGQVEAISNDPALFDQQSFNLDPGNHHENIPVILRSHNYDAVGDEGSKVQILRFAQNDDVVRGLCNAIVSKVTDFYSNWFEPFVLGVKPAFADKGGVKPPKEDDIPVRLLSAEAGDGEVLLTWTLVPGAKAYAVRYGTAPGTYTQQVNAGAVTSFTIRPLTNGVKYYFVVCVVSKKGLGPDSNELAATPVAAILPLTSPILNDALPGDGQVALAWSPVSGADGYKLYYGTASGNYGTSVNAGNVTGHTVTGLTNNTVYYFAVGAYDTVQESALSNEQSATPVAPPQPPLAAPVLNSIDAGDAQVTLSWSAVAGAGGYNLYYGTASGAYNTSFDVGNTTGYTVTGLINGSVYYFAVSAHDAVQEGALSNEESAVPEWPVEDPQLFVRDVDYNAQGQVTRIVYGNDVVTTYTYDPLTLRLTRIESRGPGGEPLQDLNYTYDPTGNVLSITDNVNSATQSFQYDALNRLIAASGEAYGTKAYAYDEIGNITAKDGRAYYYGENGAGPHAVTSMSDGTTLDYDANGNMVTKRGPDLIATGYVYDAENRLVEVTRAGATVAKYEYDGNGGRTAKTAYDPGNPLGTCFLGGTPVMMADGSLKAIEDVEAGEVVVSFDAHNGEKAFATVTETFAHEFSGEYVVIDRTLRVTDNHPFFVEGEWKEAGALAQGDKLLDSELHDAAVGSVEKIHTHKPVRVYNIEVGKTHSFFVTRGRDDRNGVLVHNKFPGETANAVYEGTTKYVGSLFETNSVRSTKHVFLGGTRVAAVTNGKVLFYHGDHLGGANVLTAADGTKKELIEYEPFGTYARHERYGLADEVAWFYFTGKQVDDESGLMFYGARYYDPDLGRFLTADSLIAYPGNPQVFNRYAYCHNNPVNLVDPTGEFGWFVAMIVGVIKGAIAGAAVGAAVSAATGGDIGQGAMMGAIGGAAFSGLSSLTGSLLQAATVPGGIGPMTAGAQFTSNILGGVVGGAAAGASVAGYLGADPLQGAGIGALSGGVFGGIGMLGGGSWQWDLARVGLAGIAGGAISELGGGSFGYGAAFAGTIAGADAIYRAFMRTEGYEHGASMGTAKRPGAPKLAYDKKGNVVALKVIHDPTPYGKGISNVGGQSLPNVKGFLHFLGGETGPMMSFLAMRVPGFQGLSHVHDITSHHIHMKVGTAAFMTFFNFQTMPPIYGLNAAGAVINDNPSFIGIYEGYGDE